MTKAKAEVITYLCDVDSPSEGNIQRYVFLSGNAKEPVKGDRLASGEVIRSVAYVSSGELAEDGTLDAFEGDVPNDVDEARVAEANKE